MDITTGAFSITLMIQYIISLPWVKWVIILAGITGLVWGAYRIHEEYQEYSKFNHQSKWR